MRGGKREEKKGACTNVQGFQFPNASNLCHAQIDYSCFKNSIKTFKTTSCGRENIANP